jgi:hypothetical protein
VQRVLRHNGARCVIVFHDALPYGGSRLIDRLRRACQLWVMRTAYRCADRSVLPVSLDQVTWLPRRRRRRRLFPSEQIFRQRRRTPEKPEQATVRKLWPFTE